MHSTKRKLVLATCLLMAGGAHAGPAPAVFPEPGDVEYHAPPGGSTRLSEAVRVDNILYLSGKLGTLPGTRTLAEGGIQAETRQAMQNIRSVLDRHGSSMNRVVKCTVFLADIREWADMNEIYVTFFEKNPPARSAVAIDGLVLGARVEIECLATVGLN